VGPDGQHTRAGVIVVQFSTAPQPLPQLVSLLRTVSQPSAPLQSSKPLLQL